MFTSLTNEYKGELIFLHKVKDGAVDDSYGIQVAKLADLPTKSWLKSTSDPKRV